MMIRLICGISIFFCYLFSSAALAADDFEHGAAISYAERESYLDAEFSSTKHRFSVSCKKIVAYDFEFSGIESRSLSGIYFKCEGRAQKHVGDIIYLVGGPYQWIGEFPDPYIVTMMTAGYDIYVPRYPGTFGNSIAQTSGLNLENVTGGGEITVAAHDVAGLTGYLMTVNADASKATVLFGESSGGYLAAMSCALQCTDNVILLSPLMQSPLDFWNNFAKSADATGDKFYTVSGSEGDEQTDRQIAAKLAAIGFYGSDHENTTLCHLLATVTAPIQVRIFYGDRDPRIGVNEISNVLAGCGTVRPVVSSYQDDAHAIIQTSEDQEARLIHWLMQIDASFDPRTLLPPK